MNTNPLDLLLDSNLLRKAALVYSAINHPVRQQILQFLHLHRGLTVSSLYTGLKLGQAVCSNYLSILRKAGLVTFKREGRHIYYAVNYPQLQKLNVLSRQLL